MNMSRIISFGVLVLILGVISAIFFRVVSGFLVPTFLAALLGVIFQPLHNRIHARLKHWGSYATAGITTFIVTCIVLTPAVLVISLAILEGLALTNQIGDINVRKRVDSLRTQLQLEIPHRDDLKKFENTLNRLQIAASQGETDIVDRATLLNLQARVKRLADFLQEHPEAEPPADIAPLRESLQSLVDAPPQSMEFDDALHDTHAAFRQFRLTFLGGPYRAWLKELVNPDDRQVENLRSAWLSMKASLLDFGGDTASFVGRLIFGLVIMLATLFFIFADGKRLLDRMITFSPLEEHYVRELLVDFDRTSRAIVLATILSAAAQGLLAGIGYQVAGVGSVFLLMLLTGVLAMVPFLGAASVWVSVCLWIYFYEDRAGAAIGLAIYGLFIVSTVDNIIKPWVLHGQSNLHPLLALLSILGGVQTLGPIGILIGPMSVAFLQTLARILQREYKVIERRLSGRKEPSPSPDHE